MISNNVFRDALRPGVLISAALVFALSSGCAVKGPVPDAPPEGAAQAYDAAVGQVDHWKLQGRVAVRHLDKGWTASIEWAQRKDSYHIDLTGPFGQGAVELQGDSAQMQAHLAGEDLPRQGDPVDLMRQVVGWDVPVLSLRYWVRGLADPSAPALRKWDGTGRPIALEQLGWQVEFTQHSEDGGLPLPVRMTATRADWRFKLVVDAWSDQTDFSEGVFEHEPQ